MRTLFAAFSLMLFAINAQPVIADVWDKNGIPGKLASGLQGVGLNSNATWTSCRVRPNSDAEVSKVLQDGWSHFVYVVCIDDVINIHRGYSYDQSRLRQRMKAVGDQINRMSRKFPKASFVISMKGRMPVGGWNHFNAKGLRTTEVYQAYEQRPEVRERFVEMWQDAAKQLSGINAETLAFNLMNEPEYHDLGKSALSTWKSNTLTTIDAIRSVSPDRVIIVEGIFKSLIGRKKSPKSLLPKLPRDKLVYAFHYYEPDKFTHVRGAGGADFSNKIKNKVKSDMKSVVRYSKSQKVPVVISEFGVWGPYLENGVLKSGVSAADRAAYAKTVYDATITNGVGITWWALGDDNTPYQRLRYSKKDKSQPRLIADQELFLALGLQ